MLSDFCLPRLVSVSDTTPATDGFTERLVSFVHLSGDRLQNLDLVYFPVLLYFNRLNQDQPVYPHYIIYCTLKDKVSEMTLTEALRNIALHHI